MLARSLVSAQLAASKEGLSSVQMVGYIRNRPIHDHETDSGDDNDNVWGLKLLPEWAFVL
jgi:hypothetical protein